jgi:S1-C subfamily serine protease
MTQRHLPLTHLLTWLALADPLALRAIAQEEAPASSAPAAEAQAQGAPEENAAASASPETDAESGATEQPVTDQQSTETPAVDSSSVGTSQQVAELPAALRAAEDARVAAMQRASVPTLAIFGAEQAAGGGSGVVITPDGYALTNFHVAQPCGDHMKCGMNDGKLYDAVVVGIDPTGDVALIKLLGRDDFPTAVIADSDTVRVGQECFAAGNPFLLATDFRPTITFGVVSGVHRYQYPSGSILEYADCIQTDAAINPGNSGGPLFNAQGELIGINGRCSFEKRGRVNVGVGYAISMNQIQRFLGYLRSGRIVDHATLGATVATDERGAVVVTNILESSDAFRRGLRYGDQVVEFGGRPITSTNAFKNALGTYPQGWRIPLVYLREGERNEILVRLEPLHSSEELLLLTENAMGPPPPGKAPEQPPAPEGPQPAEGPKQEGPQPAEGPEQEGPQPAEGPKPEAPQPDGSKPADAPGKVPPDVARWLEKRRGYANYHFNRLERERVWAAFQKASGLAVAAPSDAAASGAESGFPSGTWTLDGPMQPAGSLRLVLEDHQASAQLATAQDRGEWLSNLEQDLAQLKQPEGSGGLYVAMHLWRRFLTQGPAKFGEVLYWGTAPLAGHAGLCDVLLVTHADMEARMYFDPASGSLLAMETYSDNDQDPCELFFGDYRAVEGRQLPSTITIKFGDTAFGAWKLETVTLAPIAKEGA